MELSVSRVVVAQVATAEDIERAVDGQPRGEDWELCLDSGADDFMEAMLEEGGTFSVDVEEKLRYVHSTSPIDDVLLKSILVSFLQGDGRWRELAHWKAPDPVAKQSAALPGFLGSNLAWVAIGFVVLLPVLALLGLGKWIVVLFAAAFPGIFAVAIVTKMAEARKAAGWTKGSAKILRSAKVTKTSSGSTRTLPDIQYEFSVGLAKHLGTRVSIGEIMSGTAAVDQAVARYRVGASVPVYYDPANPAACVLERDLPKNFALIWLFVAILAIVCVGGAVMFVWGVG